MRKILKISFILILFGLLFGSCESEYTSLVKKELASGEINEELLFGLKVGDKQKDFFKTCWRLNKEEVITHGPDNKYALFKTSLDSTAEKSQDVDMLFYAIFDDRQNIIGMDLKFKYAAWAPWNEDYQADVLAKNLTDYYLRQYPGNSFLKVDVDAIEEQVYVKVDGNRQIKIYPISDQDVVVKIEDLRKKSAYKELVK